MENYMMAEYHNQLREWTPLTDLLNKLPRRIQSGITSHEVKVTCIDIVSDFIALGTNLGVVYWYNRTKRTLQRLRCEDSNSAVTTIAVISTVDYMLACGNTAGSVNIFQIPKSHPDDIPTNLKPKNQQIERYLVSEMHKSAISALSWSKNGMKLFSGDKNGIVVYTELDFYMHICKSVEILNETYEVVQLSYYQHNLLISTTYRSIICQKQDKWNITQIGKKDRKIFGEYGGIIYSDTLRPNNLLLYCSRPGLRIWISDVDGNVQKTLLFKDILNKQDMSPVNSHLKLLKNSSDVTFGRLLTFQDSLLVTFCTTLLYVLDPSKMTVLYKMHSLKGILDVATNKEEIFILEDQKNIVRLAFKPESTNDEASFALPINSTNWLPSSIRMLGVTLDGCAITPNTELDYPVNFDTTTVVNAEEALECTESPDGSHSSDRKILQNNETTRNIQKYNKISQEDYDDSIIFKHRKPLKSNTTMSMSSSSVQNVSTARGTVMNLSTVSMLPDLRSPESIKSDIESKEKIIAEMLDFNKVKIDVNSLKLNGMHVVENGAMEPVSSPQRNCDEKCLDQRPPILKDIDENDGNDKEFTNTYIIDGKSNDSSTIPDMVNVPTLALIPPDWNLSCVKLKPDSPKIDSDNSLNDWEII